MFEIKCIDVHRKKNWLFLIQNCIISKPAGFKEDKNIVNFLEDLFS